MKLTYRGIKYEYAPVAIEVTEAEVGGKYRGAQWKRHYSHIPELHHATELKYRGASYYSGNPEEVEELKQRKKLNSIFASDEQVFIPNHRSNDDWMNIHSQNLCQNLQYRLQIAKLRGDEKLIRMLEDEANQLSVKNCQLSFDDY